MIYLFPLMPFPSIGSTLFHGGEKLFACLNLKVYTDEITFLGLKSLPSIYCRLFASFATFYPSQY